MTPPRQPRADEIMEQAIDRTPDELPAFLDEACGEDLALRKEVESLLEHSQTLHGFLERSVVAPLQDQPTQDDFGLGAGDEMGAYRIIRRLGKGGMAVVYLATDPRLPREVAIKVLPQDVTEETGSVHRFKQEARAASALNHPNIITIYDVGFSKNRHYIVTEFIDGETLRERLARSPMTVEEALRITIEVARALKVAHAAKIVHRDIKPENIMIRRDGLIKVLDFGIAKLLSPSFAGTNASTIINTVGILVGTPRYMSQEQWARDKVDARTDLFSLGAVLYECLTGEVAFPRGVAHNPDFPSVPLPLPSQLNHSVPVELDGVVLRTLSVKDGRYESADELLSALEAIRSSLDGDLFSSLGRLQRWLSAWIARLPIYLSPRYLGSAAVLLFVLAATADFTPRAGSTGGAFWYNKGVEALRGGAYQLASIDLEKAINEGSALPLAHARLAESYLELENKEKARAELYEVSKLAPDLSRLSERDGLYVEAVRAMDASDYSRAIDRYSQIVRLSPTEPSGYIDLGRVYEKNNQWDIALTNYREAAKRDKTYASAFLRQGILYGRDNQEAESEEAFKTADDLYSAQGYIEGRANVRYQRGVIYLNNKKAPAALSELKVARELARASGTVALEILSIFQMSSAEFMDGDPQKAQETAREAVGMALVKGMQGLVSRGLVDLGNAFFTRGGPDDLIKAEKYFREALDNALIAKDRRNEIRARFSLGSLAVTKGAIDEALPNLEQAKAYYLAGGFRNELLKTLTLIGRSTRNVGNYDEALAAFQQQLGLANTPSAIADAHLEIAKVLLYQEDYPAALIHLDESHKLERELSNKSQLGYVLMNRARALWQLGRYEEASADFDQAAGLAAGRYLALASAIDQFRAEMDVSRNRFDLARPMILRFSKQADATDLETLGEAERLQGLIETSLHNKRAVDLCEAAVEKARKSSDPQVLSMAQFTSSEAMLEMNQWQAARDRALDAAKSFERARQLDSGWRAYLVASLASRGLNDAEAARKYSSQSGGALSALKARWGGDAFEHYSKRPDIQAAIRLFNRSGGQ